MKDKVKNVVITIVFFGIIASFCIINIVKEDSLVSISERRKLATFPEFSVSKLVNGTFFTNLDRYAVDQFVARESFRKLKVETELNVFYKKDYNDLYEYDGYLIEKIYPLNESSVNNVINKINNIQNTYLTRNNKVYFTIVPDKNYFVNEDNLKIDYSKLESMMSSKINAKYIQIKDILTLNDYYKTDSHWKQENIQKVADIMLNAMGSNVSTNYEEKYVANFSGTYAGRLPVTNEEDKIIVLNNNFIQNAKVYNYEKNTETKVYDYTKINSLDKYDVYLSGAVSILTIENSQINSDKELIVFRDSYGSSLIPLFISSYRKITVVDTRYISSKLLDKYITFANQDVLFMYSTLLINNSYTLK